MSDSTVEWVTMQANVQGAAGSDRTEPHNLTNESGLGQGCGGRGVSDGVVNIFRHVW